LKILSVGLSLLLISGCASYGVVDNKAETEIRPGHGYSLKMSGTRGSGDITLILAFSGGGTRAAALAYGVLLELRDTKVVIDGAPRRLLDEVDAISSVSGGSFTSAYYGLFGERIFEDFEGAFLKRNIESELLHALFNPLSWFSSTGRTEMAVSLYQQAVFHGKTFADMKAQGGPLIVINASDLGYGMRFSFVQEYFDLLCSELSSYPVARAVAASSAVPVLFNPVVVRNYSDCGDSGVAWMKAAEQRSLENPELIEIVDGIKTYANKDKRRYIHFVDGGITDNLGLRALYEVVEVAGGAGAYLKRIDRKPPRRFVVISVDASTDPEPKMDKTAKQPSLYEAIQGVSSAQLHRYNSATLELMREAIPRWAEQASTPQQTVEPHFIQVGFHDFLEHDTLQFFNRIPTSFDLSDEQVDRLISAGRELLRRDPEFQRLVAELGGIHGAGH
jgi:NTE family protein